MNHSTRALEITICKQLLRRVSIHSPFTGRSWFMSLACMWAAHKAENKSGDKACTGVPGKEVLRKRKDLRVWRWWGQMNRPCWEMVLLSSDPALQQHPCASGSATGWSFFALLESRLLRYWHIKVPSVFDLLGSFSLVCWFRAELNPQIPLKICPLMPKHTKSYKQCRIHSAEFTSVTEF